MESLIDSGVSFEDVDSDSVLVHSHQLVNEVLLVERLAQQESLIQLGQHHIKRLRAEAEALRAENKRMHDEYKDLRIGRNEGKKNRDGKTYVEVDSDHLECPICYSRLEDPHVTPCGHIFCQHCLEQWFRCLQSHHPIIAGIRTYTCPKCTAVVPSPPPPAYALKALLDSLTATLGKGKVVHNPDLKPKAKKAWIGVFFEE